MLPLVDLKRQYQKIQPEIDQAIRRVLEKANFINGEEVRSFESNFAKATGAGFSVGTSSGTTALHLALEALDIGVGDEVLTVANTFIATGEAISQTGAVVKFIDIDPETYNINVDLIEKNITAQTRAIVPVCLYGQACDFATIEALAKKYNLKVVIDAAQAHLVTYNDKPLGSYGDAVCYSFYPGKNLGAYGDAGIVTTNDKLLSEKMRMLANHGRIDKYEHLCEGYNYRLDELQAAILNVKLNFLPEWTKRRRNLANMYDVLLAGVDDVVTPFVDPNSSHVFHLFVIRVKNRDKVAQELAKQGISTGVHYPIPLHLQPAYQYLGCPKGSLPVTEQTAQEILSLPLFPELTIEEVHTVVVCLKQILAKVSSGVMHHVPR